MMLPESRYTPKEHWWTMDWKRFSNEITEEQAKKVARILRLKIGNPTYPLVVATMRLKASTRTLVANTRVKLLDAVRDLVRRRSTVATAQFVGISKRRIFEAISHERMTTETYMSHVTFLNVQFIGNALIIRSRR